jgi:hypothetical protein
MSGTGLVTVAVVSKRKPLQVGVPSSFAGVVAHPLRHVVKEPLPILHGMEGVWLTLKAGPLPVPITVRIDRTEEGRFIITGLVIGLRERKEITWETMRQIRLAAVLEELFVGYDPMNPAGQVSRSHRGQSLFMLWELHSRDLPEVQLDERPRRHAAPNLREVVKVYLRNLAATPNKATAATATELHCSRATVIRRLAEARTAGLLPPKESKK